MASGMPAKFGDFSRVFAREGRGATLICLVLAHRAWLFVIDGLVCARRAARARMRSRGVLLLLLVGAFVAVARADDVTASSPQTTKVSYADCVEHYRRGDDDRAFRELAALTDTDIRIGRRRLLEALAKGNLAAASILRAAAVLHTVRAFAARAHYDAGEFANHFWFAQTSIDAVTSFERRHLRERWPGFAIGTCCRTAPPAFRAPAGTGSTSSSRRNPAK